MTTAYIKTLKDSDSNIVYPQTKSNAVFTSDGTTIDVKLAGISTEVSEAVAKASAVSVEYTLLSSKWSNSKYPLSDDYPYNNYDIEVQLNGDSVTEEIIQDWTSAQVVGSFSTNDLIVTGTTPTHDIPIILTYKTKQ